jgi:hypothetical protein
MDNDSAAEQNCRIEPMTPRTAAGFFIAVGFALLQVGVSSQARAEKWAECVRLYAGYSEPYSVRYYDKGSLGLREHFRNEMQSNVDRGSTDVYVHIIRIGTKAWYHSDVVERQMFRTADEIRKAAAEVSHQFKAPLPKKLESQIEGNLKWTDWMQQGDPMAVALEEGHAKKLKIFADVGMNVTHIKDRPFVTEAAVRKHPEFLSSHNMFMDYRRPGVRDYVVLVCRELLMKYDLDGLNMDFARWGYKDAYDVASLDDVVRRIHEARKEAERKWGHNVLLAVRIPSYLYNTDAAWGEKYYGGEHPWFLEALRDWAREGWIDRAMVCSMSKNAILDLSLVRYRDALSGTKVELWGDLYGFYDRPQSELLNLGRKWISEGLNGGFFIYDRSLPKKYENLPRQLRRLGCPELVSVEKIWDKAPHSAFTDLIRYRDKWYCTFREDVGHVGGDGKCRVLESTDGKTWASAALIEEDGIDLRDPKLSITPDGRLMMVMGGSVYRGGRKLLGRQPRVAFSSDAHRWTPPQRVLEEGDWLWRVTWHKDRAYGVSYSSDGRNTREALDAAAGKPFKPGPAIWKPKLVTSCDGVDWRLVTYLEVPNQAGETTLRVLPDSQMIALMRCSGFAKIGTSRSPYTEWKWHKLPCPVGGPNFIVLPDGTMWAGGRGYPPGKPPTNADAKTVLARFGPETYEPLLALPSGGDTSYPGMVWHDNLLWMSYYSSHEGKTSIYLAKIKLH